MLAACVISKPKKIFLITSLTTLASVSGGIIGWCIGLYIGVGLQNLVDFMPGLSVHKLESVNEAFREWGLILTFIGAFTPLPYKLIALSSGATGVPLLIFVIGSIVGRGIRFTIVALLSYYLGEKAINFIKNNLALTSVILAIIIIIIWFLII